VGRIQNFKNWSPDMVPDPARTALGLEYFVDRGDELWESPDEELVALARREIGELGLAPAERVADGTVVRVPNAYPVYDEGYGDRLGTVRAHLAGLTNLQMVGRNGQHRYNNQDHSMLTGIYAARNALGDALEIWDVNVEDEYHEEASMASAAQGDRQVPALAPDATLEELLQRTFRRLDVLALGVAVGAAGAMALFLATAWSLASGAADVRPLSLLGIYLLGYEVSWRGALLGLFEGGALGFLLGVAVASTANLLVRLAEDALRRELDAERAIGPLHGAAP
jgi:hypothetical protein